MEVDLQSLFGLQVMWCARLYSFAACASPYAAGNIANTVQLKKSTKSPRKLIVRILSSADFEFLAKSDNFVEYVHTIFEMLKKSELLRDRNVYQSLIQRPVHSNLAGLSLIVTKKYLLLREHRNKFT